MKKALIFLVAVAITLLTGCVTEQPPAADSPEPPAHSGKFVSEYGSMTFNGDGESITVCFEDAFAAEAGFPLGECEGTYVFKFQQKAYRYDKAEYLSIYIGEKEFLLRNVFRETNENIISVMSPAAENETLQFVKSNAQD